MGQAVMGVIAIVVGAIAIRGRFFFIEWMLPPDAKWDEGSDSFFRKWSPIVNTIAGVVFVVLGVIFVVIGLVEGFSSD